MKKYILFIICLVFTVNNSFSQEFIKDLQNIKKVKILELYGNLNIDGISTSEIQIGKGSQKGLPLDANMAKPEFFKNENTNIGLCFEYYNGIVIISPANQKAQFTNYNFKIPKSAQLEIKTQSLDEDIEITDTKNTEIISKINVMNIEAEINIELYASDISLNEITGPIALAIFMGNYQIDFSELNQLSPSNIEMYVGNVDVTLPKESSFDIQLDAGDGEIYSEFKIDIEKTKDYLSKEEKFFLSNPRKSLDRRFLQDRTPNTGKKYDFSKVIGKVNNGGISLSVHTSAGTVNLKKK
jgi:hypothetical protein